MPRIDQLGSRPGSAPRVLVIADRDDQRRQLVLALEAAGWLVTMAADLRDGMAAAMAHPPAAIVTELALPDTRGFQFARTLRSAVEHDVQLIAVTRLPEEMFEEARRAGFDRVFANTVPYDVITRALAASR